MFRGVLLQAEYGFQTDYAGSIPVARSTQGPVFAGLRGPGMIDKDKPKHQVKKLIVSVSRRDANAIQPRFRGAGTVWHHVRPACQSAVLRTGIACGSHGHQLEVSS